MEDLIPFTLLCALAVGICYLVSIYQRPANPTGQKIVGQAILQAPNGATCQVEYDLIINNNGQLPVVVLKKLNRCLTR